MDSDGQSVTESYRLIKGFGMSSYVAVLQREGVFTIIFMILWLVNAGTRLFEVINSQKNFVNIEPIRNDTGRVLTA